MLMEVMLTLEGFSFKNACKKLHLIGGTTGAGRRLGAFQFQV